MSIVNGLDFDNCNIGNFLTNMYYYILDKEMIHENNNNNSAIFGFTPNIQSISFNPFANKDDFEIVKADFNKEKFSYSGGNAKVYRIKTQTTRRKKLGEIPLFHTRGTEGTSEESKLQFYPYRYFLVCDYINPPLLIKPELVNTSNSIKLKVMYTISSTSKYNLYVERYKNDYDGALEGTINNNALLFPTSSSAFAEYMASSSSAFHQSLQNSLLENDLSLKQNEENTNFSKATNIFNSGVGAISGLLNGQIGSSAMNIANGFIKNEEISKDSRQTVEQLTLNRYEVEKNANAKVNDLLNTPRTMKTIGNDAMFTMMNGKQRIDIIEYGIKDIYKQKIERIWERYGYKVNEYMIPQLRTRRSWDFIKTTNCQIVSNIIPREDMLKIEDIFNKGITIWHNKQDLLNYNAPNEEWEW